MKEYIEREKVVELTEVIKYSFAPLHRKVIDALIYNIDKNIPSADVEPVRHGRWIVKGQDIYCSVCDSESAYNPFGASKFSNYCPECGAKMDGGKK